MYTQISRRTRFAVRNFVYQRVIGSYSQYCEDLVIDRLLSGKSNGTYVDVGANDPVLWSNTARFYRKGWSGVNVEPNHTLHQKLCAYRPRDVNLNAGVGPERGEMEFYELSSHAYSTFSPDVVQQSVAVGQRVVGRRQVPVVRLSDVFEQHLADREVDFLSVDVEGLDLQVLQSNDWDRFRPYLVLVEINRDGSDIIRFMQDQGYSPVYVNHTNAILADQSSNPG